MSRLATRHSPPGRPGGERVFTDDDGRCWSAALSPRGEPEGALVFRCLSDPRQSQRAIVVDPLALPAAADDVLRRWLGAAPRIGTLT